MNGRIDKNKKLTTGESVLIAVVLILSFVMVYFVFSSEKPAAEFINKTYKLTKEKVAHNLYRYENREVICYGNREIVCKFKNVEKNIIWDKMEE